MGKTKTPLAEMVHRWAWNDSPRDARQEASREGYDLKDVAAEMLRQGYKQHDVEAVVGKRCPHCFSHFYPVRS